MCNIEFPHFGASYPDAHCINGYLWDMDSYENGCYTIGGDDPCPFCNTEAWLKTVLDNEEFASREESLAWVEKMREKWGAEHLADARKTSPKDLEEAADEYASSVEGDYAFSEGPDHYCSGDLEDAFIAGAKWDRSQMMKKAVEYEVWDFSTEACPHVNIPLDNKQYRYGDKVRIIIVKEDKS